MSADAERWFEGYDNPQKPLVLAVREAILSADPRIGECIKWQAPTYAYKGNMASFNPRARKHVSLVFHTGAEISGGFPSLAGDGAAARTFKVTDAADLAKKRDELQLIVRAWCDLKDRNQP
jgi:hypothetical protein